MRKKFLNLLLLALLVAGQSEAMSCRPEGKNCELGFLKILAAVVVCAPAPTICDVVTKPQRYEWANGKKSWTQFETIYEYGVDSGYSFSSARADFSKNNFWINASYRGQIGNSEDKNMSSFRLAWATTGEGLKSGIGLGYRANEGYRKLPNLELWFPYAVFIDISDIGLIFETVLLVPTEKQQRFSFEGRVGLRDQLIQNLSWELAINFFPVGHDGQSSDLGFSTGLAYSY